MTVPSPNTTVTLPPGVSYIGARQGSQPGATGSIEQGQWVTYQLVGGEQFTLFVPYSALSNPDGISATIAARAAQLQGLFGATPSG